MLDAALVLLLAQTCVAEIDFQIKPDECYVMWEINVRQAKRRGVDLATQTRAYSAFWRSKSDARQWIRGLTLSDKPPKTWPADRVWRAMAPRWLAYRIAAADFVERVRKGTYRARCRRARSYGGKPDDGIHADDPAPCARAKRIVCLPDELQAYWDTRYCRYASRKRRPPIPAEVAKRGY